MFFLLFRGYLSLHVNIAFVLSGKFCRLLFGKFEVFVRWKSEPCTALSYQSNVVLNTKMSFEAAYHVTTINLCYLQKITQSNTWDLKLIDHLSALVHGDDEVDDQASFQKASTRLLLLFLI